MIDSQTLSAIMLGGFGFMGALMLVIWNHTNNCFNKVDQKITDIDKKLGNIETRVTVIESKIVDMNQNITRLMWQNQLPHKDIQEKQEK